MDEGQGGGGGGGLRKRMVGQSRGGQASVDQVGVGVTLMSPHSQMTVCQPHFAAFLLGGSLPLYRKDSRLITVIIVSPMGREE